mmetsp:Transcript_20512/g.40619  ORF Transcript_20512/g.40619 Transcript_20512/m.40619 type:complete len:246 (+) Transcript_20512:51-788(+)
MTHLENFLDSLKTLPNDLQRTFALIQELDNQHESVSRKMLANQDDIIGMANHKVTKAGEGGGKMSTGGAVPENAITEPTENDLFELRQHQFKAYHLCNEKIALTDQATMMIKAFISRLDEDLTRFQNELGDEAPQNVLSVPRRKLYEKRAKGMKDWDDLAALRKSGSLTPSRSVDALSAPRGKPLGTTQQQELYCTCQSVSFGEMVGCDNDDCRYEWFHLSCVGLKRPPKGSWYCQECRETLGLA